MQKTVRKQRKLSRMQQNLTRFKTLETFTKKRIIFRYSLRWLSRVISTEYNEIRPKYLQEGPEQLIVDENRMNNSILTNFQLVSLSLKIGMTRLDNARSLNFGKDTRHCVFVLLKVPSTLRICIKAPLNMYYSNL